MNLFVWNHLKDRNMLSYILRHTYKEPLEPAILKGYIIGASYPDMLFPSLVGNDEINADIAPDLTAEDFVKLDNYHALDDKIHRRLIKPVKVMRFGRVVEIQAHVYVSGETYTKFLGRLR